jgi:hypothetical protein
MIATTTPHLPLVHTDRTWTVECYRCQGGGSVSWGQNDTGAIHVGGKVIEVPKVCYLCHGVGFTTDTLRLEANRAKARARREAKAAKEWAAGQADRDAQAAAEQARRDEWAANHADVIAALPSIGGDFGQNLRDQFAANGELREKAVELIRADIAARATAGPVPAGRVVVTGEIVGTKVAVSYDPFGREVRTPKMIVRDDRGFKVFGTMPSSLDAAKGDRVTFSATVEASQDDETFGFFKRPTKASVLQVAEVAA